MVRGYHDRFLNDALTYSLLRMSLARRGRALLLFVLLMALPCFMLNAVELSAGVSLPSGGIINSLYLSGNPISGVTIKVRADNDIEYTAFFGGGAGLISIEKIETVSSGGLFGTLGSEVYAIYGASLPIYFNLGGGIYLLQTNTFGLSLQYVTLIGGGGTVLGSNSAGPSFIGWLALLLTYQF